MDKEAAEAFEQKLADYKQMVVLRQDEVSQIANVLEEKGRHLSQKGKTVRTALIILGAVVATKAALELVMLGIDPPPPRLVMNIISLLFLIVGAAVSMIAALEKTYRFEENAGELRGLSTQGKSYNTRFMSDYKKYVDPRNPEITLARLESLIDLQNQSLDNIRQQSDKLEVDLSGVNISYRI